MSTAQWQVQVYMALADRMDWVKCSNTRVCESLTDALQSYRWAKQLWQHGKYRLLNLVTEQIVMLG